jgi:hypothetical protein
MVVYFVPEQARNGGGSQQSIIAQGEPVREGQKLMQIPDLRKMLVNTKVHEALVARVRPGQPVSVRINAYPDRLFPAHVESVATISMQQDFWAPDVKFYSTKVALDGEVDNLKPGMSAEVKIAVSDPLEKVLTIPVEAVIGSAELGSKRRCYVMVSGRPTERDIEVGMSNERVVEVRDGLKEGDQVVLNPKTLVGDKLKTRQPGQAKEGGDGERRGRGNKDKDGGAKESPPSGDKPGRPDGGAPGGAPSVSPEERQKRQQEMTERFQKASPEERKGMLEKIPEEYREKARERLKAAGIDVPS